ncbi:MAG: cyclase family protein [Planctomycetota bacterium]
MNRLIDITRPLSPGVACWPGDQPTELIRNASLADGASVNLSSLTASVHNSTHVDATLHYDDAGQGIEALDLALYVGPCVVLDVRGSDPITAEQLPETLPPRVLFKTGGWPDSAVFPDDFPVLHVDTAQALRDRGARLIGVDVPSVDKPTSKDLPVHHALHAADLRILESLDLSEVQPGPYELIALPILIPGSDGAFVRAVLRSLQP